MERLNGARAGGEQNEGRLADRAGSPPSPLPQDIEPRVGVGREERNRLEAGWDQPLRASNTTLIR